jgi:imidazolonepropionase-like amidohydrolase
VLRRLEPEMRLPHVRRAIRLGVPDGHGTESPRTRAITNLVTSPADVHRVMPGLIALNPDMFKVFADGWRYADPARPDRASMDLPTLTAIVAAAHAAGIKVVTHTVSLDGLKLAAAARVDAVVHGIGDALIDPATVRLMKARGIAYVPTLAVYEPQQTRTFLPQEIAMLRPVDRAREEARRGLPTAVIPDWDARRWQIMQDNVRVLHAGGVRIGVGTDAGLAGVYHGWATIREIRWLVRLGLSAAQALHAATGASAAIMGAARTVGRLAPGQRADLVLTGGRPDVAIDDLYDIRRIFVAGREIDLTVERALRAADAPPSLEP